MTDTKIDPVNVALRRLGVDPTNLGCVMLNVRLSNLYRDALDQDKAYHSSTLQYVKGFEGTAHVTLLYGLLLSAQKHRNLVDSVLEGWTPPAVLTFYDFDVFYGQDDQEYGALVLKPGLNHWDLDPLEDANARLSKLPHVRSFYRYRPHVTIGYVQRDYVAEALTILKELPIMPMATMGLDYGD